MVTTLSAGALRYTVATDFTSVWRVLLTGRVLNEFTGRGVDFELQTDPASLFVRVIPDGGFAIAGYPELDVPPTPDPSMLVQLDFQASGYRPARHVVPLPSAGPWPVEWPPVLLRPLPGVLQGRVTQDVTPSVPLAGAHVFAQDPAQHAVLLRTPVLADASAGTPVREIQLNPVPLVGPAKHLVAPAAPGDTRVMLNDRQGIVAGNLLRLDDARLGQLARIQAVSLAPADLTLPGDVTLTLPLQVSLPAGTPCVQFAAAVVNPPDKHLAHAIAADEAFLRLDADVAASVLELTHGTDPSEYHDLGALTDAAGYYAVSGFGGLAAVQLNASAGGFPPPPHPPPRGPPY
ncbi:MAG: hypothetical protein HS113_09975 [Verrucomicrobiales bacterium]|nr:hypothetical protein [Verrucomicrobiales bacterium]